MTVARMNERADFPLMHQRKRVVQEAATDKPQKQVPGHISSLLIMRRRCCCPIDGGMVERPSPFVLSYRQQSREGIQITATKRIEAYMKECFDAFRLDIEAYFYYGFDEDKWTEIQWVEMKCMILYIVHPVNKKSLAT